LVDNKHLVCYYISMIKNLLLLVGIAIIIFPAIGNSPIAKSSILFDFTNLNEKVTSKKQIDEIFSKFRTIPASKLTKHYLLESGLSAKKYKYARKNKKFYLIPVGKLPTKILGNNRLKDIISKGPEIDGCIPLLIDKRVLYKYIEMYQLLKKEGYNPDDIRITAGHRHPAHNDEAGGAYTSKHIIGQALDFDVGDINNNGVANIEDKMIVYKILNRKVIKSKGGIGKYSWHPHGLHIDVRGHRARWDSFSRKK